MYILTTDIDNYTNNGSRNFGTDYIDPHIEITPKNEEIDGSNKIEYKRNQTQLMRFRDIYVQKRLIIAVICFLSILLLSLIAIGVEGWSRIQSIRSNIRDRVDEHNRMSNKLRFWQLSTKQGIDETWKVNCIPSTPSLNSNSTAFLFHKCKHHSKFIFHRVDYGKKKYFFSCLPAEVLDRKILSLKFLMRKKNSFTGEKNNIWCISIVLHLMLLLSIVSISFFNLQGKTVVLAIKDFCANY